MTMIDERAPLTDVDHAADEPPDRPETPARDRDWRGGWANAPRLLLIVLAWAVIVVAVFAWQRATSLADERDDRRDAAQVASEFTTAIQGYDSRDLGATLDAATALATHDYGQQLEDAWFSDLQPIVEQLHGRATVRVSDVLLGDESDGAIPAVVVFDARVTSTIGTRNMSGTYLRLDLVKVDGTWKVDDMAFLASTNNAVQPAAGAGATPASGN